jgi:hypothetical protein
MVLTRASTLVGAPLPGFDDSLRPHPILVKQRRSRVAADQFRFSKGKMIFQPSFMLTTVQTFRGRFIEAFIETSPGGNCFGWPVNSQAAPWQMRSARFKIG